MLSQEVYELRCKELILHLQEWGEANGIPLVQQMTLGAAAACAICEINYRVTDDEFYHHELIGALLKMVHQMQKLTFFMLDEMGNPYIEEEDQV